MSAKGDAERRAELQTLAYGQSSTLEAQEAARRAREELDRLDAGSRRRRRDATPGRADPGPVADARDRTGAPDRTGAGDRSDRTEATDPGDLASVGQDSEAPTGDDAPVTGRRRRVRILVVAGVAIVAVGVGAFVLGTAWERSRLVALASAANGTFGNAASSDGTFSDPSAGSAATSRLGGGDPATVSDPVGAARQWFASKQTAADKYDLTFGGAGLFSLSSTRLIADSARVGEVWVAEKNGGGFCLISLAPEPGTGIRAGAISCATESQYAKKGLDLTGDDVSVTWFGASLAVSLNGS